MFVAAIVPLLILVVLHEGIVRSRAPFEEPSLRQAEVAQARRDKARGRRTTGRGARESAVYRLRPGGPAAGALTWKNLMQISRFRFVRLIPLAVLVLVFWAVVPSLIGSPPWIYNIAVVFALWGFFFMPLISAMGGRNDLRRELGHIEMLRTWPIGARSLVWAEVASPAIVGAAVALFSGLLGVASVVGAQLSERMHGIEHNIKIGPDSLGGTETSTLVWMLLGLVSLWPVAASATFLICSLQNLATLLFPAWVGVGDLKPKGMAASGQNLLTALALGLAMLIATIPGALLVALTILLFVATGIQLALWQLPIAGLLLLAPYWLEMIFVNRISARLWLELDPSEEILEGGT
ncbi:MAG: hypothetical protein OEV00_00400 [Acidobacteriota bacterium]|nr:hypothetical protein [Acidobacteriota bacterium]MDH3783764.1 hypothetical protein [Acidobacteriota bacterium]